MTSPNGVEGNNLTPTTNYDFGYTPEWLSQKQKAENSVFTAPQAQQKEKQKKIIEYDKNGYPKIYVESGETPAILAKKFGCTAQEIINANRKAWNGKFFKVGQSIVIPKHIEEDNIELQKRKTKQEAIDEYVEKLKNPKGKKAKDTTAQKQNETTQAVSTSKDSEINIPFVPQQGNIFQTKYGFQNNSTQVTDNVKTDKPVEQQQHHEQKLDNIEIKDKPAQNDAIPDLRAQTQIRYGMTNPDTHKINLKSEQKLTGWRGEFQDYKPTNQVKYDRIYNRIIRNKNLSNKSDAKYIANMVCTLSDRYGLDPEITVSILEKESQFNFIPEVMVHNGSQYKGVMQVSPEVIRCMYANPKDATNTKISQKARNEAYAHTHYKNDDTRIKELKAKYPTVESLYQAIQTDVALGIEVGIMAYKAKLSVHKGSTTAALAEYCGKQYKFPADSLNTKNSPIPRRIYPIPQYKA